MGMRLLTKKFCAYTIGKFEKEQSKAQGKDVTILDFIDIGDLSVSKMIFLIRIGNANCSEEEAGEKLDNFLADEKNGLIDAYIQLLDELDRDIHIFKGTGIKVSDLRKEISEDVENKVSDEKPKIVEFKQEDEKEKTALKDGETPKVDINGYASLDNEDSNF